MWAVLQFLMAYHRSFHWGTGLALLFGLTGCGLILETTPAPAPTDSGRSDARTGDAGPEDSAAADSGADDTGAPPPVLDGGPEGCGSSDECDDGNPCTTDKCIESACDNTDNSESCDDGVFCNGPDKCDEGSCSVHEDDDPCGSGTVCDEAVAACVGCIETSDCPDETTGDWGACVGFADVCGEAGTRTRTTTSYVCDTASGTCIDTDTSESDGCMRSIDGTTCAMSAESGWSTCGLFDTVCDTTGTQSRTVVDYACAAGTCGDDTRTESRPCARMTDGYDCIRPNCNFGTCSGSGVCVDIGGDSCLATSRICCGNGLCARSFSEC
ncbi:MAG: hypothetical protein DRJ42_18075 [Deltaproteobacteria bacterium]|nr:MAG: hypothetical protein DRJ42_18075 [Deltaproteobacteria bacterium]